MSARPTPMRAQNLGLAITGFTPRCMRCRRMFHPVQLVRRRRLLSGAPRIRNGLRPRFDRGAVPPRVTPGGNFPQACSVIGLATEAARPAAPRDTVI